MTLYVEKPVVEYEGVESTRVDFEKTTEPCDLAKLTWIFCVSKECPL